MRTTFSPARASMEDACSLATRANWERTQSASSAPRGLRVFREPADTFFVLRTARGNETTPIISEESDPARAGGAFIRVAHASRVLAEASRLSALLALFTHEARIRDGAGSSFRRDAETSSRDGCATRSWRLRRPSPSERISPRSLKIGVKPAMQRDFLDRTTGRVTNPIYLAVSEKDQYQPTQRQSLSQRCPHRDGA